MLWKNLLAVTLARYLGVVKRHNYKPSGIKISGDLTEESFVASDEDVKDIGTDKKHAHAEHITQHRRINQTDKSDT